MLKFVRWFNSLKIKNLIACMSLFYISFMSCGSGNGTTTDGVNDKERSTIADAGNIPEHTSADQQTPSQAIQPLANTAFVYIRYVRSGGIGHLYTYDLATKRSQLISQLDDDGQRGTTLTRHVDLSPDRRWVAFSAVFRPSGGDQEFLTEALWVVSVDGKHFRRVTEPLSDPHKIKCNTDADCVSPSECNLQKKVCIPRNFTTHISGPQWTYDGQTLFTAVHQNWMSGTQLEGGSSLASVPSSGGVLQIHPNTSGCAFVSMPSPHPKQGKLAAIHSLCRGGSRNGLYAYNIPPNQFSAFFEANIGIKSTRPVWNPLDDIIYFMGDAQWDTNVSGIALGGYNFSTKQIGYLIPPLPQHQTFGSFDVSPDAKYMAVCIFDSQKVRNSIYLLDSTNQQNPWYELLTEGDNCHPSW
jgi:Tol biopolymer transport system component